MSRRWLVLLLLLAALIVAWMLLRSPPRNLDEPQRAASSATQHPPPELAPPPAELSREPGGTTPAPIEPSASSTPPVAVESGIIWLRVLDETTRRPLVGALLRDSDQDPQSSAGERSDASGLVVGQPDAAGLAAFRLDAAGHAFAFVDFELGYESREGPLEILLPRSAVLEARLLDAAGAPLATQVSLSVEGWRLVKPEGSIIGTHHVLPNPTWKQLTGPDGRVRFEELPAGVELTASLDEPQPWTNPTPLVLQPGELRMVEWRIGGGCTVSGRITDQYGKPVTRHAVQMEPASRAAPVYFSGRADPLTKSAQTGDDGRFLFEPVQPGTWWIGPAPREDWLAAPSADEVAALAQVLEIQPGQTQAEVDLRADRGLTIRGQVLDSKGQPASKGTVTARPQSGTAYAYTIVRADGSFEVGPLAAGRYAVRARGVLNGLSSEPVEAEAGAQGVVVRLLAAAALSGRILGVDGKQTRGTVTVSRRGSTTFAARGLPTDDSGAFRFSGLEPGRFDLAATSYDGSVGVLENIDVAGDATAEGLVVQLQPGGGVQVRYDGDAKYATVTLIARGITIAVDPIEKGMERHFSAPLGAITLRLYEEGVAPDAERTLELRAGTTPEVVFGKDAR